MGVHESLFTNSMTPTWFEFVSTVESLVVSVTGGLYVKETSSVWGPVGRTTLPRRPRLPLYGFSLTPCGRQLKASQTVVMVEGDIDIEGLKNTYRGGLQGSREF